METTIQNIQEKIGAIQLGLLRYSHHGKKVSVRVKIAVESDDILHCVVTDDTPIENLLNKNITLIQKDRDNYMYIGGRINSKSNKNKLVLSVDVKKACWFILKKKGSVSWLQEKCTYLPIAS